jgi:hypothetical protein
VARYENHSRAEERRGRRWTSDYELAGGNQGDDGAGDVGGGGFNGLQLSETKDAMLLVAVVEVAAGAKE